MLTLLNENKEFEKGERFNKLKRAATMSWTTRVNKNISFNWMINMPWDINNVLAINIHDRMNIRDDTRRVIISNNTPRRANNWFNRTVY
jgi:hypothetical protein